MKQAGSALKAAIKTGIYRPQIQVHTNARDETRRQGRLSSAVTFDGMLAKYRPYNSEHVSSIT